MKLPRVFLFGAVAPALSLSLQLGCAAGSSVGPVATLHAYAAAVRAQDAKRAYALLSAEAQRTLTFADFERMLRDDPEQAQALAVALEEATQAPEITAQVTADNGETLQLVYEDGAWKADLSAIDWYSQATPEKALRSFVRAFEAGRYDVLLRFVPSSELEGLTPEVLRAAWEGKDREDVSRLVQALRASLSTATSEVVGNRATVAYGAGATIHLVSEAGVWKIEAF
jgi:hypothetical protein